MGMVVFVLLQIMVFALFSAVMPALVEASLVVSLPLVCFHDSENRALRAYLFHSSRVFFGGDTKADTYMTLRAYNGIWNHAAPENDLLFSSERTYNLSLS
ncbi:unnamed protein product [Hapterophycus canaliculatus]